jgi:hypothetical protein
MAYLNETSSVKTIVPGAEVSGFADVVARQKIGEVSAEVPKLSAGEGIGLTTVYGKTVITNNISAGENISFVYDQETNTYRIDGEGGGDLTNYYKKTETSSKQEISSALQYVSSNAGHTYSGIAPIQVNNTTDQISITGESLSAGPGIDMFSSGGYVVVSSTGKELSAGPGIDLFESGGYFVISSIPSNTCCVRFTDTLTSVDLSSYLNYDKVTIVHSNDGAADCNLYWDGKTKVFPSGLYCEMVKGTNEQNIVKWSFANSGWINDNWWDWD